MDPPQTNSSIPSDLPAHLQPIDSEAQTQTQGAASVSLRTSLLLLPYPYPPYLPTPYTLLLPSTNPLGLTATEPTSTLVLTTPSSTFLDLRVLCSTNVTGPRLPNTGGPSSRLDWGFGGKSTSFAIKYPGLEPGGWLHAIGVTGVRYSSWTHWMDSRVPIIIPTDVENAQQQQCQQNHQQQHSQDEASASNAPTTTTSAREADTDLNTAPVSGEGPQTSATQPSPGPDSGIMFTLPHTEIEVGLHPMTSPYTSALCAYEETWEEIQLRPCWPYSTSIVYVVLRAEDLSRATKGMVVRVGQYCQGLLMRGEHVGCERWEWQMRRNLPEEGRCPEENELIHQAKEESKAGVNATGNGDGKVNGSAEEIADGNWTRTVRIGDVFVPCAVTFKEERLRVGDVVKHGDVEWVVEELGVW